MAGVCRASAVMSQSTAITTTTDTPAGTLQPPEAPVRMFAAPTGRRLFSHAPQSLSGFVAALLEPGLSALTLLAAHWAHDEPFTRPSMVLLLLVLALTFPGTDRFRDRPLSSAVDILVSWAWLSGLLLLCGYATHSLRYFEWPVLGTWLLAAPALQWCAVVAGRDWLRWRARRSGGARTAVIVGAGRLSAKTMRALQARSDQHTDVLGCFDDRNGDRNDRDAQRMRLGALADVGPYVREQGVTEVYITLPLGSQPRILALLESLQGTTASVYFVPDVFGISIIQGRLQDVNGVPVVGICETPFTGVNDAIKRASDVVLAGAILLAIAPLLLLVALGVKLSSPGPVIFKQRRNGLGGEEIVVYKFRSMRTMDDGAVVRQATRGDPRITPFGRFLRRSSLDELPQLINVLQGRMSIVGPRPHAVAHNEQYAKLIKAYMVRHKVRPGITGWAQVNGLRGETDTLDKMRARVEYDLEYLRNWSLSLDLQIIARTLKLVVYDQHAH
jgi:putative colanic acid biosysnthesis UDP-glucose lipid carrier transferase